MMKALSAVFLLFGVLLFTYGAVKLAKSPAQQIESADGFEVQQDLGERHFALRASGTGAALALAGASGLLFFARRRTN